MTTLEEKAKAWAKLSHLMGSDFSESGGAEAYKAGYMAALEDAAQAIEDHDLFREPNTAAEAIRKLGQGGES